MKRSVLTLAKYGGLFLASVLGVLLLGWVVASVFSDQIQDRVLPNNHQLGETPSETGGGEFTYRNPSSDHPQSYEDELQAKPIEVIPERQSEPLPVQTVSDSEKEELGLFVRDFLLEWENFEGGEGYSSYSIRLSPYVVPDRLNAVSRRLSNRQPEAIGPCSECVTGSELSPIMIDPKDYMVVRRLDEESAWVTTQGVVTYYGGTIYDKRSVRRTYSVMMERSGSGWRVSRVVADTVARL